MKYNILGFKQEKLIENNLSTEDALILRTIKDMYSSSGMEFITENNVRYMWMNYTYLLRQLPIVGSKRNLMRRIEFYGKELFLLRVLKKEKRGIKGNFSYISPTEKLDSLQDLDLMTESHKVMTKTHNPYDKIAQALTTESHKVMTKTHNPYDKIAQALMTESHNKDSSSNNDSSINDSINTLSCKQDRTEEKNELNLGSDGIYKLHDTHLVDQRSTNGIPSGIIGKVRLGKDSIDKNKEKKKSYLIDSYSKNEDLISSLKDFIEMRKKIKAPMTERAVNLMLSKLSSMTDDDTEKIKIINQSIMYSWKGIFPVRGMLPVKEEKRHDRFPARDDGEESVDWGAFDGD